MFQHLFIIENELCCDKLYTITHALNLEWPFTQIRLVQQCVAFCGEFLTDY